MISLGLEPELKASHTLGKYSTLPLNYTPVAKGFFLLLFSGLQERDLFEIMRYIDIVSLIVFSVLYTASSQATHICRHSYEYIICFDNSYPGI